MPCISSKLEENISFMEDNPGIRDSFDVVSRQITVGGKNACMFLIDGFCKDEMMQKILQFFMEIKPEDMPENAEEMSRSFMPYVEVDCIKDYEEVLFLLLSGAFLLFVDGFDSCIVIDARTYPSRGVEEPEKDKSLRGSKDGFVETLIHNTALIRRRIRSTDLCMEMHNIGKSSKTDVVVCYMKGRVDRKILTKLQGKIDSIHIDALTMNQETLAEHLMERNWYNPYPKFKYTERPDTAAAHLLEGNVVILVDNSATAMIIPTSFFDLLEEADDYYFPPITGSYLRLTRFFIALLTYLYTPTFLLFMMYPQWLPETFQFLMLKTEPNIPIIWQFLLLELAIDGLKLAAVNTPNMLSTPLSVLAAIVLGEFAVESGWFNGEILLYMAFVAIANYTQSNFELGYAIKFQRILSLILTACFGIIGYFIGIVIGIAGLLCNKTYGGRGYLYPLIPWDYKVLKKRLLRTRLKSEKVYYGSKSNQE